MKRKQEYSDMSGSKVSRMSDSIVDVDKENFGNKNTVLANSRNFAF